MERWITDERRLRYVGARADKRRTTMNAISKVRFDALASYCPHPMVALVAKELRWFEFAEERVRATLLWDTDNQFSAVILARDLRERYRWIPRACPSDCPEPRPSLPKSRASVPAWRRGGSQWSAVLRLYRSELMRECI